MRRLLPIALVALLGLTLLPGLARSMLGPGLYFVRLTVPGRTIVRRFVYMR